jgi:hypothetical protein
VVAQEEDTETQEGISGGGRCHFRISEKMKQKVMLVGDELGFDSLGMAARHLMLIGLEVALHRQAATRTASATERMSLAMTPDAFEQLDQASRRVAQSILDTTGISRPSSPTGGRRQNGPR